MVWPAGTALEVGTAAPQRSAASSKRFSFVYDDQGPTAVHLLGPHQTLDCELPPATPPSSPTDDDSSEADGTKCCCPELPLV